MERGIKIFLIILVGITIGYGWRFYQDFKYRQNVCNYILDRPDINLKIYPKIERMCAHTIAKRENMIKVR